MTLPFICYLTKNVPPSEQTLQHYCGIVFFLFSSVEHFDCTAFYFLLLCCTCATLKSNYCPITPLGLRFWIRFIFYDDKCGLINSLLKTLTTLIVELLLHLENICITELLLKHDLMRSVKTVMLLLSSRWQWRPGLYYLPYTVFVFNSTLLDNCSVSHKRR